MITECLYDISINALTVTPLTVSARPRPAKQAFFFNQFVHMLSFENIFSKWYSEE